MKTLSACSSLLVLILSSITASAQSETASVEKRSGGTVIASASGERVRFTAPSSVVQIRLEIYSSSGQKVFDNEVRGGNVLDWHLQDGHAEPLADGSYLCVVTVKSLSGRISQRMGSVAIEKSSARAQPFDASQITAQQLQAIGPVEGNASLSVLKEDENQTTTVIAHNSEEGQITRGRGALSFRVGDFYSGKDIEQMRLTAEGNLGIGITHPQARLDVDGLIRTSQGIMFPDGSIQTTAFGVANPEQPAVRKRPGQQLSNLIRQNKASAKTGKSKDSVSPEFTVNEDLTVNGNIIFTPSFYRDIAMQNNSGGLRFYGAPSLTGSPGAAAIQFWGNNSGFPGQAYIDSGAHDQAAVIFRTAGTGGTIAERMRITATGNVGIGITNPAQMLTVRDGIIVDQGDTNNGTVNPGVNLGGGGESIASQRTVGANQYGMDFYTNFAKRMSITNEGNVGVGTTGPIAKLHAVASSGLFGVFGESGSNAGVHGFSGSGNGVSGFSSSNAGVSGSTAGTSFNVAGVYGEATANTGTVVGVYGKALNDPNGTGVAGFGSASGGYFQAGGTGLYGVSTSGSGFGGVFRNTAGAWCSKPKEMSCKIAAAAAGSRRWC